MAESKPTLEAKDFIEAKTSKELFSIMNTKGISSPKVLDVLAYEKQLRDLQIELVKAATMGIKREHKRVAIIFEGRDAAGKGGSISDVLWNI